MGWGQAALRSPLCSPARGVLCVTPALTWGWFQAPDQYTPDAAGGAAQVLVGGAQHKAGDGGHADCGGNFCAALPSLR